MSSSQTKPVDPRSLNRVKEVIPVNPETGLQYSKGAWKKLKKQREKEAKKAAKAAERAKKLAEQGGPKKKKVDERANEENLDPTKYRENRIAMMESLEKCGVNPYPHKFDAKVACVCGERVGSSLLSGRRCG